MARVLRLTWRLDFETSFAYLDKRGSALSALTNTNKSFWKHISDGPLFNSFMARYDDPTVFRNFALEPNSLNGVIEWAAGFPLDRVLETEMVHSTNKIIAELCRLCEIRSVRRVGIRFGCVDKIAGLSEPLSFLMSGQQAAPGIAKLVRQELGAVRDLSLSFQGQTASGISYTLHIGPNHLNNVLQNYNIPPSENTRTQILENNAFFDIDLFEENISFVEHNYYRWSSTKLALAKHFAARLHEYGLASANGGL